MGTPVDWMCLRKESMPLKQRGFLKETALIVKEINAELPLGNVWEIMPEKRCLALDQFIVHEIYVGVITK